MLLSSYEFNPVHILALTMLLFLFVQKPAHERRRGMMHAFRRNSGSEMAEQGDGYRLMMMMMMMLMMMLTMMMMLMLMMTMTMMIMVMVLLLMMMMMMMMMLNDRC